MIVNNTRYKFSNISTTWLNTSPCLHLSPINLVIFQKSDNET